MWAIRWSWCTVPCGICNSLVNFGYKKTQDLGFESWKHMGFMGICEHVHKKHWGLYNLHTWIYVCQWPVNSPTMDHLSGILNVCFVMEKGDRQNPRISDSSWVKAERIQWAPCKRSPTWALQVWEQSALRGPKQTQRTFWQSNIGVSINWGTP